MLVETLRCPFCNEHKVTFLRESREYVCMLCGYVIRTLNVDFGPEWRNFGDETSRNRIRVGPPESPLYTQSTTFETIRPVSYKSFRKKQEIDRVKRLSIAWSQSTLERNLVAALNKVRMYGELLNLPDNILERAAQIYRSSLEKDLIRGRDADYMILACLYLACKEFKIPMSLNKMIADAVKCSLREYRSIKKSIGKCYRTLIRELNIKPPAVEQPIYLREIISKLSLPDDVLITSMKVLELIKEKRATVGKNPIALASAIVYYTALLHGYKVTQRDIAKASNLTEISVRNRCKYIEDKLGFKTVEELRRRLGL